MSPDSDHSDSPLTSDATPPTLQAEQSVVLSTSNPPPYEWRAKCAHCTQEIGFVEGPQYKCSTCPNYLLCDICQNIITEERNDQYEDNDWEYLLPHEPTHSVYRTEVPDSSSPSVLHTSHPPHGTDLEHEKTPAERKRIQCFCVLHADTKDHNTPECPDWTRLEGTTDLEYRCQGNDYCWDALKRYNCCIGCLMQGHSIGKCSNVPPRCPTCAVCHNKRLLCHGMDEKELRAKSRR